MLNMLLLLLLFMLLLLLLLLVMQHHIYINIYNIELALLNAKSEIFSACRHKKQKLLIPKVKRKKKPPGT